MITTTEDGAFRVSCTEADCPRPLMRIVASAAHAGNLERKHEREFHGADAADEVEELATVIRDYLKASTFSTPQPFGAQIGVTEHQIAAAILAAGYAKPPM